MSQRAIHEADLHAFADNEMSAEAAADVARYLLEQPAQAARVEIWRRQSEILRASFARVTVEPVPPSLSVCHPRGLRSMAEPRNLEEPIRLADHRLSPGASQRAARKRVLIAATSAFLAGLVVAYGALTMAGWKPPRTNVIWPEVIRAP